MIKLVKKQISRRQALVLGGKVATVGTVLGLNSLILGCGENLVAHSTTNSGEDSTNTFSGTWASGSTDLIQVDYPEDSIFASSSLCSMAVDQNLTMGPCYFADTTGEDISEGITGLPMQLCLQLIDSNCNPLQGYKIEVWHCDKRGVYSGDTRNSSDSHSFQGNFCTGGDTAATSSTWFRGMLITDNSGRVNFKSCFPGWYSGRTIHIHFSVVDSNNNRQFVSQLCFTDKFADEICTTHDLYKNRGPQDTPLSRDGVFPSDISRFILNTKQNSDGSLLAYHSIQLI